MATQRKRLSQVHRCAHGLDSDSGTFRIQIDANQFEKQLSHKLHFNFSHPLFRTCGDWWRLVMALMMAVICANIQRMPSRWCVCHIALHMIDDDPLSAAEEDSPPPPAPNGEHSLVAKFHQTTKQQALNTSWNPFYTPTIQLQQVCICIQTANYIPNKLYRYIRKHTSIRCARGCV